MSEENVDQAEEIIEEQPEASVPIPPRKRTFFSKRNFFISFSGLVLILFLFGVAIYLSYRFGYFDNYIKTQFINKMDEIGVVFSADVFRIQASPLTLQLKNATFNDKLTGDRLFRVGEANLTLSVKDLYAWQLSRDISIDTTDLQDVEAWVKFDADGKSNFSNIKLIEPQEKSRVNFTYSSIKFSLKEGIVHFGDVSRKINADAKNLVFFLEPENYEVPDEQKRYKYDFTSTDSVVVYDEKPVQPINIKSKGIVDNKGAEITQLSLVSPLGENSLTGTLTDWKSPKYNFNIESNVDLQQVQTFLPNDTFLRGIGNFKGTLTGEGEKYKIDGEITSESLAAANIRLKALQVNASFEMENSMYNANGKAVAEMLTFEDFQIDFPQLVGNIRGTGTDFKWLGELQAAALKSPNLSLGRLYISDAVAEYKDKKLEATLGKARTQSLLLPAVEFTNASGEKLKVSVTDDARNISAPTVRAQDFKTKGFNLHGLTARNLKVNNNNTRTEVNVDSLQAQSGDAKNTKIGGVTANNFHLTREGNSTKIKAATVNAATVNASGAKIGDVRASQVDFQDNGRETTVYTDNVRVAKVETDMAVMGSLNVAGVRLRIVGGRVEGTSGDINAGNVALTKSAIDGGGQMENVRINKPVFLLEPSGRYRITSDMSLGGGVLGSVKLGAARASVVATNDQVELNNLNAGVMEGTVNGNAVIAFNNRNQSRVDADFANLDLAKLLALQGGKVVPIEGQTTGKVNLTFPGTNIKSASGTLTADFAANAGTADRGLVPVNGKLGLRATNGLFDIDYANLNTEKSKFDATGRFDLNGSDSNLNIALNSTDASEIDRIIRVLNVSPDLENQLNSYQAQFAGNLNFTGTLTGNLTDPTITGRAQLDSIVLKGRDMGSLATNVSVSPAMIELTNGKLQQADGGNIAFNVNVPRGGTNNIAVQATLDRVNTGNLLAALPVQDSLPEPLRDFNGQTSGTINLTGLPNNMSGSAQLKSTGGTVAGQSFDSLDANVTFQGTLVNIEKFNAQFGEGFLSAKGTVSTDTKSFNLDVEGKNIQVARVIPLFTKNVADLPAINGTVDLTAKATGTGDDFTTYNINFKGAGQNVTLNQTALGTINFEGVTANQRLNANVTANFENQQQAITATLNFGDPNLPFRAETNFNQTELAPYIALLKPLDTVAVTGKATGRIFVEGNLYTKDANGVGKFTTENLKGNANFTEFGIQVNETPFVATQPLIVSFNPNQIMVESGKFAGAGSNLTIDGAIALNNNATSNLTINGKINLRVFDAFSKDTFFGGLADLSMRVVGTGTDARLTGTASLENSSFSTFVGNERINLTAINGRLLFTSNQVQIDRLDGKLGGGKITASGGAVLSGVKLERFRFDINGKSITAPLMDGFIATADADVEFSGFRVGDTLKTRIAGDVLARRGVYTKDIDLADVISNRRTRSISTGGSSSSTDSFIGIPELDLRIDGRDALIIRNNIADVRASASLRVTGDFQNPVVSGRLTANQGTLFFRNDRYEIQRGFLEFPPDSDSEPIVNIQAETDIQGYQIIVTAVGSLSNTENLSINVRSNPALPQVDVVSLITTGNLSNTGSGIPTLASSGINTAAEVITDSLINDPIRKATDKLFGLNKFEIDPLISGKKLNASARLTVGRQINRNLAITYSTNLSEDQNQVLALEYRVSNRLSFVAQYEQRSLSNVTRNNNNFSFEIRLRRRF